MKSSSNKYIRNFIIITFIIILLGISFTLYSKSISYPITKTNENKVDEIHSYLLIIKSDLDRLNKLLPNKKEKATSKVITLEGKIIEDIGKLDTLLENFTFNKLPDKGLLLWIDFAYTSKDAYLMEWSFYDSKIQNNNFNTKEYEKFIKRTNDDLDNGLKVLKEKHKTAYKYFNRHGYFEGFFNN